MELLLTLLWECLHILNVFINFYRLSSKINTKSTHRFHLLSSLLRPCTCKIFSCNISLLTVRSIFFRYSKFDRIQFKMEMMRSYDPYVQALRGIILDTFDVILAIIGIQVFIKLFSSSVFKLLLAFDLIRQIKVYKTKRPIEAWTCKGGT